MRVLLDTHVFLWWIMNSSLVPPAACDIIAEGTNELFLSVASGWEIAIKANCGRLWLPDTPEKFISEQLALNSISSLPILMSHALRVYELPNHHRDPFDRLLVAQAQLEDLPILTLDETIARYDVQIVGREG